eukprot:10877512-Lingulodinium_polyedra.AAC.1
MAEEVFAPATALPWSLGQGDIQHNLETLHQGPPAEEPITWKIQELLRRGTNRQMLEAAVRLLMDCSWSTTT